MNVTTKSYKNLWAAFIAWIVLMCCVLLVSTSSASAHVVVKPSEVLTASWQTFTVSVPNEKDTNTTKVKLLLPSGLSNVLVTEQSGWQATLEKNNEGTVTSIAWQGTISPDFRADLSFSAKAPDVATKLQWKAYQTYADGSVVSWDKPSGDTSHLDEDSGPFSVTSVVSSATTLADSPAATNKAESSPWALYIAAAALLVSLVAFFAATRPQKLIKK